MPLEKTFHLICLFVVLPGMQSVSAQQKFTYEKKIEALVQPFLDNHMVQAVSIGVVLKGKTWTGHFGQLSPDNDASPNDETIYEIGSITKVFTSLLLADAIKNSKTLKLDQTIGSLLPGLDDANPDVGKTVTLKQLSNHVSGLPRMPGNIVPKDANDPFAGYNREMLNEFLHEVTLNHDPGTKYEYSNLAAGLLGDLISAQGNVDYDVLLKKRIAEPLKMCETSTDVVGDRLPRLAPPFNSALLPEHSWHFDALAGAGAIRSTVTDMLKFIQANLNPPENEIGQAINLAWEIQMPATAEHRAMGLGWIIAGDGTTRWHNGQTGGYQSMMLVSRDLNAGVILLCNTAGSETDELAESIFQTVVGMKVPPRKFTKKATVDAAVIARLVGKYQLAPGIEIDVTSNEGRMMVQLTGQQALRVAPESDTVWNYRDVEAKLEFELPTSGSATKVTLLQNGMTLPAPRKD